MILLAFSAEIEVAALDRRRSAEHADRKQLGESLPNALPARECGQVCVGESVLLLCPRDRLGIAAVLQPAIGIDDLFAMEDLGKFAGAGFGVGWHQRREQL